MTFKSAPIFEIVRLIDLQPMGQTGFCMLVTSAAGPELVRELEEELVAQGAGSVGVVDVTDLTAAALVEQLRTRQHTVIFLYGFELWPDEQFSALDVNRSRLETGAFLIFRVDLRTAGRFLDQAPNLR